MLFEGQFSYGNYDTLLLKKSIIYVTNFFCIFIIYLILYRVQNVNPLFQETLVI